MSSNKLNFNSPRNNETIQQYIQNVLFVIVESVFIFSSANVLAVTDSTFKDAHWIRILVRSRTTSVFLSRILLVYSLWSGVSWPNNHSMISNRKFRRKYFSILNLI